MYQRTGLSVFFIKDIWSLVVLQVALCEAMHQSGTHSIAILPYCYY